MSAKNVWRLWTAAISTGDGTHGGESLPLTSGDTVVLKPQTDDTGAINIGDGTTDIDLKVFLGASTDFVLFDVGNGHVQFDSCELNMGDNDHIEFGDSQEGSIYSDGTNLKIECTEAIHFQIGDVDILGIDDAAITLAGASATAGQPCYIKTEDGGAGTGAGTAGALLDISAGAAGAAAAGTGNAGAAGGAINLTAGAASDVGTQASGTANGGAGGDITLTAGAGGNGGDSSGTDGDGGDIVLVPGAAGSGGNTAGNAGIVHVLGGINSVVIGAAANDRPGTTVGTDWIGIKSTGTAPAGTNADMGFLYADFETDDDELFWLSGTVGTATQLTT